MWIIIKPSSLFRGSFYWMFVASGVLDLINVVESFTDFRSAIYPIANGNGIVADGWAHFRLYLSFVCPITQDLYSCFIALNRLTAISLPTKHHRFRKVFYAQVPVGNFTIYLARSEKTSLFDWYDAHIFCTVLELVVNSFTLSFYVASAFFIRKLQIKKKDRTLLIFGFVVFVVNLPGIAIQALMGFGAFPRAILPVLFYNFAWVTDVKCYAAPVTMLIVNETFRRETMRICLFWRNPITPQSSIVTVSSNAVATT
ncbi:hypothetical protein PRIPAC_84063 [Pristionchus pacificus]|uniref:Serpentine receptor class gamma n=1 Tax=Pristionchus pacificus TaxID=54126 RepID=A0A2A6BKQ7_PRIPA|nr:hypothetical protein PRIPAC_84063 [Pristionchus pacificus]|eukprot:PDM66413.1 G protein-coupled receptor [Pristionchus pacificus]